MERTQQALTQLNNDNIRSNKQAAMEMTNLLSYGNKTLDDTFMRILQENTKIVEPVPLIIKGSLGSFHYHAAGCRKLTVTGFSFPTLSEEDAEVLRSIHAYTGRDPKNVSRYIDMRSSNISTTLQNLGISSVGIMKKQNPGMPYVRGSCGIGHYSAALEQMVLAEFNNVSRIFPREDCDSIHTRTCQTAVDEYAKTLRQLSAWVLENTATECYLAFEMIQIVSGLSSRLESCTPDLQLPIDKALLSIRDTAKQSLPRLIEDTRVGVRNLVSLPPNGGVSPTIDACLGRLAHLTTFYLAPLLATLESVGESGWRSSHNPASAMSASSGEELLGKYATDMLEALVSTLETRAPIILKNRAIQGILLANTVSTINSSINSSALKDRVPSAELQCLHQWRKKGVAMYIDAWADPARELRDVIHTNRTSQGGSRQSSGSHGPMDSAAYTKGMNSKDKDMTRANFQKFTIMFDELLAKHKTYSIELDIKPDIALGVEKLIEPLYARYWQRYHDLDKGKGKYIKYDPGEITAAIRRTMQ